MLFIELKNHDSIFERAVAERVTPGGLWRAGDLRAKDACYGGVFGSTAEAQDAGRAVEPDDIYDIASVTKAVATAALAMKLVEQNRLDLDDSVVKWIPQLCCKGADEIRVRHLLGHASGLPDHQLFYQRIWAGEVQAGELPRDALLRMVGATEMIYEPGSRTFYSDLGYILLGRVLEAAAGQRQDRLFQRLIAEPLGMQDSFFVDLQEPRQASPDPRIVPTERCERRGLLRGEVHDENCHAGGGICGHAGLFSTALDLERFARAMCMSFNGESDFLRPETLRRFWSESAAPDTSWVLGWDRPSSEPGVSHAGEKWSRDGVGHLGFTGTCLWLDPARCRFATLLTNRVYYSRDKAGIKALRRSFMDEVVSSLPL